MILKISLFRRNNTLYGWVDEQSKALPEEELFSEKNYSVYALNSPALSDNELFIRGRFQQNDNDVFLFNYKTKEDCDKMQDFIVRAVEEINKKYGNTENKENEIIKIL